MKKMKKQNPDHSLYLKKLNRVIGQLEGVKRMIEERRYCPEILTQTRAAAAALKGVEISILENHLAHCVRDALNSTNRGQADAKVEELIELVRRF